MPAAAMTATVNRAAGITMAFRRRHRRRGGVRVSTGSPYAVSCCTDGQTGYCPGQLWCARVIQVPGGG
jgi:hypothetical protein